ncbi:hypothetical protein JF66_12765 [Cryobacterium sp. MLB-32]|uniref:hypothetical protein n=1 Tax=Cryobacterium sp. MLB-32 TaxID=1529318 RepID=UPI0004E7AA76|nr:hypothetical protein [Cryobacterium sp. MLB-32]KFF59229.1 hypothetical protein JF66_12765 [Cryobacterium sp. MLB-32]
MPATVQKPRSARFVTAGVLTLVPVVVILTTWLLWRDVLPSALPAQWSGGEVATTQPTWFFVGFTAVTAFVAGVFGFVAGLTPAADAPPRIVLLVTGLVGSFCVIIWMVSANLAAPEGAPPALPNWGSWVLGAAVFAFVPVVIAFRKHA